MILILRLPHRLFALAIFCGLLLGEAKAQSSQVDPYILNGTATQNSCNCYTLTTPKYFIHGSVWNKNKIDLTQSFDYHFNIFLGCNTGTSGADGLVFVLQPTSTSLGSDGDGMGFGGISPGLGVTIDTYQNLPDNDPAYDHIAFQQNGDVNHGDSNNLAGPVWALASNTNIKDCKWHVLEVSWNATTMVLTAYMDGVFRLSMQKDIVNDIFYGNSLVYWGFTASTGGSDNLQEFCTSLNAAYTMNPAQIYCSGVPIVLADSSTSFGSILSWNWDFGDGTTSTLQNPPPHTYHTAGEYPLSLAILGNNGCTDTLKTPLIIGSYPVAAFQVQPACTGLPLLISNQTSDSVGRIARWNWTLSNGQTFSDSTPSFTPTTSGNYTLQLSVVSAQGCASPDTAVHSFTASPMPQVTLSGDTAVCSGSPLTLSGQNTGAVPVAQWYWEVGGQPLDSGQTYTGTFQTTQPNDTMQAKMWAVNPDGCTSDTLTRTLDVQSTDASAGQDTIAAIGYPLQLHATGGTYYQWTPADLLSNPDTADPIAHITQNTTFTVTALSPAGCPTTASILVKAYKGPAIYVPGAFSPNGDGINDLLKVVAPGISRLNYFRVYDRWGRLVYNGASLDEGWDGTVQGQPEPVGTYVWMIQGLDLDNRLVTEKGTVVLIR